MGFQAAYFVLETEMKSLFCERSDKLKQKHSSKDSCSFWAGFSSVAGDKDLIIVYGLQESVFTLVAESFCDHINSYKGVYLLIYLKNLQSDAALLVQTNLVKYRQPVT